MKQASKNEIDMLGIMNKMQEQLTALDKKLDALINRSLPASIKPPAPTSPERMKYTAICADCKKECTIPFKPSGDRPVYCQDCFSRRKVIRLSKIGVPTPQPAAEQKMDAPQQPQVKTKKKAVAVKKPVAKKKPSPKRK